MNKTKTLVTAILCIGMGTAFSQTNAKQIKGKKIVDVSILPGWIFQKDGNLSLIDFQKMNPQSVLLNQNTQDYTSSNGYSISGRTMFSANIGISFSDKEKTKYKSNPELRIGIIYFSGTSDGVSLYKSDRKRFDTLTSSQTGQTMYSDSLTHRNYYMSYTSEQLRFDASLIYRTNPVARWSIYGGIGFEIGGAINASSDISYSETKTLETTNNNSSVSSVSTSSRYASNPISERFVNKNGYGSALYLPMGVDFRIGTQREFFKNLHLFYEMRPFVNTTNVPEIGEITNVGVKLGFGLRVTI